MTQILIVMWMASAQGRYIVDERVWPVVTMQEFKTKESCERAAKEIKDVTFQTPARKLVSGLAAFCVPK